MKKSMALVFILIGMCAPLFGQKAAMVWFKIHNRSLLPQKLVLISYVPGDSGNGTRVLWMLPVETRKFSFKEGTKIYLANERQVGTVMSGNRIDDQKPFLIVTREVSGKRFRF